MIGKASSHGGFSFKAFVWYLAALGKAGTVLLVLVHIFFLKESWNFLSCLSLFVLLLIPSSLSINFKCLFLSCFVFFCLFLAAFSYFVLESHNYWNLVLFSKNKHLLIINDLWQKDKEDRQDSQNICVLQKIKRRKLRLFVTDYHIALTGSPVIACPVSQQGDRA